MGITGKSAGFYEAACNFGVSTQIYSVDLPDDIEHISSQGKRGIL
jgi:hypothetical protein